MKTTLLIMKYLILALMLLPLTLSARGIQKWVDDQGNVHYGDAPPIGTKSEQVRVDKAPSGDTTKDTSIQESNVQQEQQKPSTNENQERIRKSEEKVQKLQSEHYDPSKCAEYRAIADSIAKRDPLMYKTDINWIMASQRISLYCFR
jgi:ribonuclease BN (tRNA processing enzyme)